MMHRSEERYLNEMIRFGEEVAHPDPGDVAIFRFGRTMSHSAIVIEGTKVIHAHARDGIVMWGDLTQEPFRGREVKYFRIQKKG